MKSLSRRSVVTVGHSVDRRQTLRHLERVSPIGARPHMAEKTSGEWGFARTLEAHDASAELTLLRGQDSTAPIVIGLRDELASLNAASVTELFNALRSSFKSEGTLDDIEVLRAELAKLSSRVSDLEAELEHKRWGVTRSEYSEICSYASQLGLSEVRLEYLLANAKATLGFLHATVSEESIRQPVLPSLEEQELLLAEED